MTEESVWNKCKNHIVTTDYYKDGLQEKIPGKSVHIEGLVSCCFTDKCPATPDVMFIATDKTIYVEFKKYTKSTTKNNEMNEQICNKIAAMALMHHRFLKGKNGIPEKSEFWIVGDIPSENYKAKMKLLSGMGGYSLKEFEKYKYTDVEGHSLFFDDIYVKPPLQFVKWFKKNKNNISLPE